MIISAKRKLECASGSILDTVGACKLLIKRPLTSFSVEEVIYVVNNLKHNLLGRSPSEKLGLVTFHGSLHSISTLPEMNWKPQELFPALFTGLGCIKEIYKIKLKDDAVPFAIHSPRRFPHKLQTAVKEKLDSMERSGVIRRVNEPTAWCAGMVVVPKGGKPDFSEGLRLCIDLVKLNEAVVRDRLVLPSVEETLAKMSGNIYFSKLDCVDSFWQVPLDKESQPLTTFVTPWGRYCFQRLTMGLHGIPREVRCDNGRQLVSAEIENFALEYGFKIITSSPHFPQSNGMAEAGVKIAKNILRKCSDIQMGLLLYRNIPIPELGASPAELLMGRKLRTNLPAAPQTLQPKVVPVEQTRRRLRDRADKDRLHYDWRHGTAPLRPLQQGRHVWIRGTNRRGQVSSKAHTPRSYLIETERGTLRRNRHHLVPIPSPAPLALSPEKGDEAQVLPDPPQQAVVDHQAVVNRAATPLEPPETVQDTQRKTSSFGRAIKAPVRLNL
ncbi:hypothetical protein B566_EDAN018368 [Ephemera danica]|nr:hypothetical protein B566_EDAN018368 [Ephemera danica]